MKHRLFIIAAAASLALGSCTDLDVADKGEYTAFPDNDIAQQAVAANCFTCLKSSWGGAGIALVEGTSGGEMLCVSLGTDWYDGGYRMRITLHDERASDKSNYSSNILSAITNCNKALKDLNMLEETSPSTTGAQLKAMRAFYTYLFMEYYGDTPILDHVIDDGEEVVRCARGTVAQWIVDELKAVIDYLPTEKNAVTYAKPTRWMADALLAKIYLNWPVYTASDVTNYEASDYVNNPSNAKLAECIAACDDIIKNGGFGLGTDYKAKFLPDNGPSTDDFIYAFSYDAASKDGNCYARYHSWRRGADDNNPAGKGPGLFYVALAHGCAGCFVFNPDFAKLFCLPGDRRNDCIYGNDVVEGYPEGQVFQFNANGEKDYNTPCYYWVNDEKLPVVATRTVTLAPITDASGNVVEIGPSYDHLSVANNFSGWTQGWRGMKFALNPNDSNSYKYNMSNDIPIFRYADILLTKAEAIVRGGTATNGDTPMDLFNKIRSFVNAPTISETPTLQDILDERGRELFDEGWRRNDVIRFGQFENPGWDIAKINPNVTDKTKRLHAISQSVLNSNTNWKQNAGYE